MENVAVVEVAAEVVGLEEGRMVVVVDVTVEAGVTVTLVVGRHVDVAIQG
jgi:hypothetical protein